METHRVPDKDQNCSKEALQATEELRPLNEIKKILHEWNKKSSKEIAIPCGDVAGSVALAT